MLFRNLLIGLLVNLVLIGNATAQMYERSKKYSESFPLEAATEVNINNKYGNIHVHIWENDSVKFEVEVKVNSNRQARVDRSFNAIDVKFVGNPSYVVANTTFANTGSLWTEISDLSRTVVNTGTNTEIHYQVWLPAHTTLKIDNRFGNVFTTNHEGRAEFRLSNGDLQANELNGNSVLFLEFGSANIRFAADARIDLNYATLDLNQANQLNLSGRSSTINMQVVENLHLNSRRDRIFIDQAATITGEAAFSRTNVNTITNQILLSGNYGTIQVSGLENSFQLLQLNTNYTVVQLYLHAANQANMEINYSKRTKINLPDKFTYLDNIELEAGGEAGIIRGNIGQGSPSALKFTMTGGEISIFLRP